MSKEKFYFLAGIVCVQLGACLIHYGLGFILLGAWLLIGSFFEYEKNNNNEEKELNNKEE